MFIYFFALWTDIISLWQNIWKSRFFKLMLFYYHYNGLCIYSPSGLAFLLCVSWKPLSFLAAVWAGGRLVRLQPCAGRVGLTSGRWSLGSQHSCHTASCCGTPPLWRREERIPTHTAGSPAQHQTHCLNMFLTENRQQLQVFHDLFRCLKTPKVYF